MPDDDPSDSNPFIRFKKYVDSAVGAGLRNIFGLPSMVSRNVITGQPTRQPTVEYVWGNDPEVLKVLDSIRQKLNSGEGFCVDDSTAYWTLFHLWSEYSPCRLDLYSPELKHSGPAGTSWVDAFDDLVTISSGLPQVSDDKRFGLPRGDWMHYPRGWIVENINFLISYWVEQRMHETFFPICDPVASGYTPRTIREWIAYRQAGFQFRQGETMQSSLSWNGERVAPPNPTESWRVVWQAVWESNQRLPSGDIEMPKDRINEEVVQTIRQDHIMLKMGEKFFPAHTDLGRLARVRPSYTEEAPYTEEDIHEHIARLNEANRPDWEKLAAQAFQEYRSGKRYDGQHVKTGEWTTQLSNGNVATVTEFKVVGGDDGRACFEEVVVRDQDGKADRLESVLRRSMFENRQ
ncbi:hypothetical protein OQA88_7587 [Cercophora sp. LCS_1]